MDFEKSTQVSCYESFLNKKYLTHFLSGEN